MSINHWYLALILFAGCHADNEWSFEKNIELGGVSPLGITLADYGLVVSDPDNNRILKIDLSGNILEIWSGFQRPMHITAKNSTVYVPEFLNDSIKMLGANAIKSLVLETTFDAPAAIDIEDNILAVADFYNHRIVLSMEGQITSIGSKGHEDGKLYYPTDVKLYDDKIYVADAYNNRVQVFDKSGESIKIIGWQDAIDVATGLEIFDDQVFVTDFHSNRVLIYNLQGRLLNVFDDQFTGPTDILMVKDVMYVTNYEGGYITVYRKNQSI